MRENRTHGLKGGRWGGRFTLWGPLVSGRCAETPPRWLGRDLNCNSGRLNQWPTSLFSTRFWHARFDNGLSVTRKLLIRRSKKSPIALVHWRSATSTFFTRPFELELDSVFGSKHKRRHTGSGNSIDAVTA